MRRRLATTDGGAPERRPTALEVLAQIIDALHVPRHTPLDELPSLVALRCRPLDKTQLKELIVGGLEQGLAELSGKEPVDPRILAECVARPLHAVLVARQLGGGPVDAQERLEDLPAHDRRVLAAICLLGVRHSQVGNLVAVTRLSPSRLDDALHHLAAAGVVTRLRRQTPGMEDAWWPTPAWHARLAQLLEFSDLVPAVEEHLADLDPVRRLAS